MRDCFRCCCATLFLYACQASAEWSLSGYLKSFALAIDEPVLKGAPAGSGFERSYQSQNALRAMASYFGNSLALELHYEVSPVYDSLSGGSFADVTAATPGRSYRLSDPPSLLRRHNSHLRIHQNLDRLNVQWQLPSGDLTIGRQAIAFGAARIINPSDIFLPFDVRTLNQEYRIGIDAVRYQRPLGNLGELDVGLIFGNDARTSTSAAFVQAQGNHAGTDFSGVYIAFADQRLIGAGLQSSIGDLGTWLEVAEAWGDMRYTRLSVGADYAVTENVFAQIEYHFNGAGKNDPDDYLEARGTAPYVHGGVFLLGRHYLIPALSWTATPLTTVSLQAIVNLDDRSRFFAISSALSLSDNLYLDFGLYAFGGEALRFLPTMPGFTMGSEYGSSPDMAYLSLRYYF